MTAREDRRVASALASLVLGLVALALALGAAEWIVRARGDVATWMEKNGFSYARQPTTFPRLYVRAPSTEIVIPEREFEFRIRTNREGLRDVDHPRKKPSRELRVAVLGDSFTEGQGAPFEDSFPQVLGRLLQAGRPGRVTILQGGCAGSDPVYETLLLEDRLLAYDPDWILLVVNGSDPGDIALRGGFDRARDGMPSPRWEWLFARSHLARLVMMRTLGFDWNGLSPAENAERAPRVVPTMLEAARRIEALAGRERRFVIVSHPVRHELVQAAYESKYADVLRVLEREGYAVLDILPKLAKQVPPEQRAALYWPIDGHFKPEGYRLFAEVVHDQLVRKPELGYRRSSPKP